MVRRFVFLRLLAASAMLIATVSAVALGQDAPKRGRKYKEPPPTSKVEVTVLRATTGKPVENASVIFHPLADGRDNGNMELKTNDEGKAVIDLLAIGSSVRLQVIAPGYQTYGEDYKVDKDEMAIEVKLKRPSGQYSIYKPSEGKSDKSKTAPKDAPKPDAAGPDAAKPDAPKDSAAPATEPQKDAPAPDATADTPKPAPQR